MTLLVILASQYREFQRNPKGLPSDSRQHVVALGDASQLANLLPGGGQPKQFKRRSGEFLSNEMCSSSTIVNLLDIESWNIPWQQLKKHILRRVMKAGSYQSFNFRQLLKKVFF